MYNERIQQMRELLLRLLRGPVDSMASMSRGESAAMFEGALPEMVKLRYDGEVPVFGEEHKLSLVAAVQQAMARETELGGGFGGGTRRSERNVWDEAIGFLRRNKAAAFGAALAVAVAILLIVFGQSWFAAQPDMNLVDDKEKSAPGVDGQGGVQPEELPEIVPDDEGRTAPDEPGLLAVLPKRVGEIFTVVGRPSLVGPGAPGDGIALPNMPVYAGMTFETGDADMLEIQFEDGSSLALAYNARITITDLPEDSGVPEARRFRLAAGKVSAKVARLEGGATFEIETPVATAVALGTEFKLELRKVADPDDGEELEAVLTVTTGHVRFENEHGGVDAFAMMQSMARSDGRPSDPQRIKGFTSIRISDTTTVLVTRTRRLGWVSARRYLPLNYGTVGLAFGSALASDPLSPAGPDDVWRVQITRVVRGSVAHAAGLKVGDVVLRVNGQPVKAVDDARSLLFAVPGTETVLTVSRAGAEHTASLTSGPEPPGRVPTMAETEMEKLRAATILGIEGDFEGSVAALTALTDGPEPAAAHNNLGVLYQVRDELGEAVRHYQAAVKLAPDVGLYRFGLSWALLSIGNYARAVEEIEAAVALAPDWAAGIDQLSNTYETTGNLAEALAAAERLAALMPNDASALWRLGRQLLLMQRHEQSERAYRKAIDLEPGYARAYVGLGMLDYSTGKFAEAGELYRTAIRLDPTRAFFHNNFAIHFIARGMIEDAYRLTKIAVRLEPDGPLILFGAGRVQRKRGDLEDAIRLFEKALEELLDLALVADGDPLRRLIIRELASTLAQAGETDEAESIYRKAIEIGPNDAQAHVNLGIFLHSAGRIDEAEAMYRKAIELDPNHAGAHVELAALLIDRGRVEEAEAIYSKASELDLYDASSYDNLGFRLMERGRDEAAEAMYRKAIELDPNFPYTYGNLGHLLMEQGRVEEAEAMLRTALELYPKDEIGFIISVRNGLGNLLEDSGRLEEAETEYRKAIELDTNYVGAHISLGNLLKDSGRLEEAETEYRKAIELDPKDASAYGRLAALLTEQGRLSEVADVYRQWLATLPDDLTASNNLAYHLAEQGESLDEALALARRAVEGDPENPYYADTLGWVHFKRGEQEEAEAALRKAVELFGANRLAVTVLVHLGQVYEAKGDLEAAKDAYRRALSIDKENEEAAEALKRLGGLKSA